MDVALSRSSGAARGQRATSPSRPLFGHQYSHILIDFRGIRDAVMREAASTISRTAGARLMPTAPVAPPIPMGWADIRTHLGPDRLRRSGRFPAAVQRGKCASSTAIRRAGRWVEPDGMDDGTIAPTAALGSLPFAPEIVIPCAAGAAEAAGLFDRYGFKDSFNPSFTYTDVEGRDRLGRSEERLGREGLSRHRPGADPAPGGELSRRFRMAIHAPGAGDPARPGARRVTGGWLSASGQRG